MTKREFLEKLKTMLTNYASYLEIYGNYVICISKNDNLVIYTEDNKKIIINIVETEIDD